MLSIGRDEPVAGMRRTVYSEKAWERFLARLGEHPFSANVTIVPLMTRLRGYSWVTVVAAELAGRLGGAEALRASGAFYEVSELRDGVLWLRATPTINDFTGKRVRRVFDALAPVLLPGLAPRPCS